MSTLAVAVATLSVNKLNDGRQCVYQVLYSVDTNGCSSTLSVNKMKMMVGNVYSMLYSVDTYG